MFLVHNSLDFKNVNNHRSWFAFVFEENLGIASYADVLRLVTEERVTSLRTSAWEATGATITRKCISFLTIACLSSWLPMFAITLWTRAAEVAYIITTNPITTLIRSFFALVNILKGRKENALNAILGIWGHLWLYSFPFIFQFSIDTIDS